MTAEPIGGGAIDAIVKRTAEQDVGSLPLTSVGGGNSALGFVNEVLTYLRGWIQTHSSRDRSQDPTTLFLSCERPRFDADILGAQPVELFKIDRSLPLGGLILATARLHSVAQVKPVNATTISLQQLHALVAQLGAGDRPAVFFFPNDLRIVVCRDGLNGEEAFIEYSISEIGVASISEESVDRLLSDYHRFWLSTPSCPVRLWHDRTGFVPIEDAEIEIERWLVPLARLKFNESIIVKELALLSGRADVALLPRPGAATAGSAVIELKVLRSKHFAKDAAQANDYPAAENISGIKDGIDQAASYRDEVHAQLALLACYDLRKDTVAETVTGLQSTADTRSVGLRHYPVFNSARAMRRASPSAVSSRSRPRQSRG